MKLRDEISLIRKMDAIGNSVHLAALLTLGSHAGESANHGNSVLTNGPIGSVAAHVVTLWGWK
ncbi:MAG: hypothetical protein K2Z81_17310 [Cyanobacteria bacterium]|nr:hypothetical protein [Cyanobacteriota bacterium]